MSLEDDLQQPVVDPWIELFNIDLTSISGQNYYFTSGPGVNGGAIVWNGNTYTPFPIQISGLTQSIVGAETRPTLSVSAIDNLFRGLLATLDDMVNGIVIYNRTTAKYLNTGIASPPFTYRISRKIQHNKTGIAWELKSDLDMDRKYLPHHQMLPLEYPGLDKNRGAA